MRSGRAVVGANNLDYLNHPLAQTSSVIASSSSDDIRLETWAAECSSRANKRQQHFFFNTDIFEVSNIEPLSEYNNSLPRNISRNPIPIQPEHPYIVEDERHYDKVADSPPSICPWGRHHLGSSCCTSCVQTSLQRKRHKSDSSSSDLKEDGGFRRIPFDSHQNHCPLKQNHFVTKVEREAKSQRLQSRRSVENFYKIYDQRNERELSAKNSSGAENYRISLPVLYKGHFQEVHSEAIPSSYEDKTNSRLSRSLDDLPHDIREHILKCQCTCDHLGYGNYSATSLEKLQRSTWETSAGGSARTATSWSGVDKNEPLLKYKQRELEMKTHVWGAVCLVLFLAGVTGVGVSLPLALKSENGNATASTADHEKRLEEAKALLSQTPLVDGHNDLPWNIRKFMHNRLRSFNMSANLSKLRPWSKSSWSHTDLPRLRNGHVGAQFWVSYVPCESQYLNAVQLTIEQVDLIKRLIEQYPNDLRLATSAEDVEKSFRDGRIASLIGVEGGHAIQNSLGVLRALYDLGVRYLTLTHTCSTPWAESAGNREWRPTDDNGSPKGLTHFGKIVVKEMNRLGILVDLSHVSQATMRSAIETSTAPVLFSHSSVYELCQNPRNVPDDILRSVAANKGLVMVSFYNQFLTCSGAATVADVIKHINHVRKIAGVDHVGIGADFDGINKLPVGLEDVSKYPNLFAELKKDTSWTDEDLKKLAGLNILRVLKDVEKESKRQKKIRQRPYEDDIPPSQLKGKLDCALQFLNDDRL